MAFSGQWLSARGTAAQGNAQRRAQIAQLTVLLTY